MSGSNSSARDDAALPEPLSFTVHSMPAPRVDERRRLSGRLQMLLVLAACAAPAIASYVAYYVVKPQGRTNHSTLIEPARPLPPALPLRSADGAPVDPAALKGQWLLVVVGSSDCPEACQKRLFMQRQLRQMVGRERERIDKIWLVTDAGAPPPPLRAALRAAPEVLELHVDRTALAGWLQPEAGRALDEHLYIVDPHGMWMMRAPAAPDPAKLKRDLDRLLRASSAWDRPGR